MKSVSQRDVRRARTMEKINALLFTAAAVYTDPDPTHRRVGKTFRSVMWSLLQASANPDKVVAHMSNNPTNREIAFRMGATMTAGISRRVNPETRTIEFPNNAVVEFRHADEEPIRFSGKRYFSLAKDLD